MNDAPEELAGEVARLQRLVDHSNELVVVVGPDGGVIDVNPASAALLGYSREQALAMNAMDIVSPEDLPRVTEHFLRHLERSGPVPRADLRIQRADGQWRWFETSVEPLEDGISFVLNAHDVTDRRRTEALLAGQSEVLQLIAARAPLAEVVAATGRVVGELSTGARTAILFKPDAAPMVLAPDLPPAWARAVTVGLMGAESAVEGIDAVLETLAAEHGLGRGWSTPIREHDGRDLGRIVVYRDSQRPPAKAEQEAIATIAGLVAIAADHQRSALRMSDARAGRSSGDALGVYGETPA